MQNLELTVPGAVFLLVSVMHILRLFYKIKVTIGNFTVPLWYSSVGAMVALLLSIWMFSSI